MEFLQQVFGSVGKVSYMVHFCGIYGVGAVIILVASRYFHQNHLTLFLGGYVVGSITEYLTSFLVEVILHARWWDYSNNILNINGRVCLLYSIFWGILTIFLVKKFNPIVDRFLLKIATNRSPKIGKRILTVVILFLILDCLLTCLAQDLFITRLTIRNHIVMKDSKRRETDFQELQKKEFLMNFINKHWNDQKMIQTFPNMKIEDINGNIIYLDSLLPEIQPYYKKIFNQ